MSTRKHETEVEIHAPVEAVWKAITEAAELARWFCLDAKVEPGPGGSVWVSWGPGMEGTSAIEIWEPNRRFRVVQTRAPGGKSGVEPLPLAVDYYLETRGESTVLRIVHSGFGDSDAWDGEYEGTRRGWPMYLRTLRHALERHPRTPCIQAYVAQPVGLPMDEAFRRLTGPEGFAVSGGRFAMASGEEGTVEVLRPPEEFGGVVTGLNDALLWLMLARGFLWINLVTYGLTPERVEQVRQQASGHFQKLLA